MENFRVILLLSFFSLSALSKKKFPLFITLFFAPPSLLSFPNFTQKIFFSLFSFPMIEDREEGERGKGSFISILLGCEEGVGQKTLFGKEKPFSRFSPSSSSNAGGKEDPKEEEEYLLLLLHRLNRPRQSGRLLCIKHPRLSLSLLFWSQGRDFDYFPLFSATTTAGEERRRGKIMRPR